jgi:hypothetical protein
MATLFAIAAAGAAAGGILPGRLGQYVRGAVSPVPVPPPDRTLCEQHGLRTTERSGFTDPAGRIMQADAFRLGARGRVARFETPAGSLSRLVFEYPTEREAQDRAQAFRALPGADVRLAGRRIGVIFNPIDREEADELLDDLTYTGSATENVSIRWDPAYLTDGPMTLGGGMAGVFGGYALGATIALFRLLAGWREGIQDRTISLHLNC